MSDIIAEISREVYGLQAHGRKDVGIKTGSLDRFVSAISRHVDLIPGPKTGIESMTFLGVNVIENDIIPANAAVIMQGDEVVNIVHFE